MKNKSLLMTIVIFLIALSSLAQETGTFTDKRDGITYKTVKIDTQIWMAENLAYKAESGCMAYGGEQKNVKTYGYLYDWETAKIACPSGWDLPSDIEWLNLADYLGRESVAGGKMKESGTGHWQSPNTNATNESNFAGLPGGYAEHGKGFILIHQSIGYESRWWIYKECEVEKDTETEYAWYSNLTYNSDSIYWFCFPKADLLSIRCIKRVEVDRSKLDRKK
ncbi:MAG: hypothetical protein NTY07_17055 [Bacteroidia bacterium]|nr:hypothetical protein [Bacteroidia bacterium]